MDDPIPAGFITLPEVLRRIANHVSEAQLEYTEIELQERLRALRAIRQMEKQDATETNESALAETADSEGFQPPLEKQRAIETNEPGLVEPADCKVFERPSEQSLRQWNKHNFAISKLYLALQAGAIESIVRDPSSGSLFRLPQDCWRFEPFWEEIVRGGIIPRYAGRGLESHRGRTVLVEIDHFESWLLSERKSWRQASREDLARNRLAEEMRGSPNDKKQTKAKWFADAKLRFAVSEREFNRAWSDAIKETGSNWDNPGAPNKSMR
jgi:hypothetical protein